MAGRQGLGSGLWRAALKRVIQKAVQDPLAEMILAGRIKDGEKVVISAGKQGLTFNGHAVAQAA